MLVPSHMLTQYPRHQLTRAALLRVHALLPRANKADLASVQRPVPRIPGPPHPQIQQRRKRSGRRNQRLGRHGPRGHRQLLKGKILFADISSFPFLPFPGIIFPRDNIFSCFNAVMPLRLTRAHPPCAHPFRLQRNLGQLTPGYTPPQPSYCCRLLMPHLEEAKTPQKPRSWTRLTPISRPLTEILTSAPVTRTTRQSEPTLR